MDWYVINKDYVNYLRQFDNKVGYVEYGDKLKLHIGIIFEINNFTYYVPVSSAKPKYRKMSNGMDFHKIIDTKTNRFYSVININNMIPVPKECVTLLKYNNIDSFRTFSSKKDRVDYIHLLQIEKGVIDTIEETLKKKAQKLYNSYIQNPNSKISVRCCNFKLLEEKSLLYNK